MSNTLKLTLDVIGILITLTGFGLLVANEKYLVSGLLFILSIALIIYAISLMRSKPYKIKSISFGYEFSDSGSNEAKVIKTTVFTPKEKNITRFEDLGIGAEGKIKDISTNRGTCVTRKDGGAISVTTTFDTSLIINQEYIHKLSYVGVKCFPDAKENVSHTIIHKMDEARISVKFHEEKRPSNVKATHTLGSKKNDITESNLTNSNLDYVLHFKKPHRGSVLEIKWEW